MMTVDDLLGMDLHEPPVMLADGRMGMIIGFPHGNVEHALVQVPGEERAREIHPSKLNREGSALWEDGAVLPERGMTFREWQKKLGKG